MYIHEDNPVAAPLADFSKFDPTAAARVANDHLKTITDPRRRKILINFRDHALAECMGDYEALMATCSKKRQNYVVHSATRNEFADHQPQSYEALCPHYKALIDLNMYVIHTDIKKLTVGDDELFIDVSHHQILPGEIAVNLYGIKEAKTDAVYEMFARLWVVFIFDEDGMGCGEHGYSGMTTIDNLRELSEAEIPAEFHRGPATIADFFAANPTLEWPAE